MFKYIACHVLGIIVGAGAVGYSLAQNQQPKSANSVVTTVKNKYPIGTFEYESKRTE